MPDRLTTALQTLARLHGVQTSFLDASGRRQVAGLDALKDVLKALGVPIGGLADIEGALRERRHALRTRRVAPVVVAWDDSPPGVLLRMPESQSSTRIACHLAGEEGEPRAWSVAADELETTGAVESEGVRTLVKRLPLHDRPALGYHRLTLSGAGFGRAETLVIAAPRRAFEITEGPGSRTWGVFCPPYALHRASSWGAGDLGDLDALMGWVAERGGGLVATLPLLATRFDDSASISPYAPSSRLFWNEFYLDPSRIPELEGCEEARALMESAEFRRAIEESRRADPIHYGRQMALKRRVLRVLADDFFARESPRQAEFRRFVAEWPEVEDYATFMAAGERHGRRWADWPESLRTPGQGGEVDERARRYHLFVQWQADGGLRGLARSARDRGLTWYVDFPVGVDPDGYDAWSRQRLFVAGASIGCPPDPISTQGQDWRFPPMHPERQREDGYRYLIAALRRHLRDAGALRIDHAAGLHRLYWVPPGGDARGGAYVRYPAEELYAILGVESHRRGAWIVGEDLGTIPPEVRPTMARHGIRRMFITQHELQEHGDATLGRIPEAAVASLNTHDVHPFASFWRGLDIPDRLDLGLVDDAGAAEEEKARTEIRTSLVGFLARAGLLEPGRDDAESVLHALWAYLARSPARALLLNIEDLWLETEPQNTPGTDTQRPNWRRKLRLGFEEFRRSPEIAEALRLVDRHRRGSPGRADPPKSLV